MSARVFDQLLQMKHLDQQAGFAVAENQKKASNKKVKSHFHIQGTPKSSRGNIHEKKHFIDTHRSDLDKSKDVVIAD